MEEINQLKEVRGREGMRPGPERDRWSQLRCEMMDNWNH